MTDPADTIATRTHRFPMTTAEFKALLDAGHVLDIPLGSLDLLWKKGERMPPAVLALARLRGVLSENMDGDGI